MVVGFTIVAVVAATPLTVRSLAASEAAATASVNVIVNDVGAVVTTLSTTGFVLTTPKPRARTSELALSRPPVTVLPASAETGSVVESSRPLSSVAESVGATERARAAAPATCGDAMLVPESDA
jgi:hypothetical protein